MKTIYIHRTTEDPLEDMGSLKVEFDLFVDGTMTDGSGGLLTIADALT